MKEYNLDNTLDSLYLDLQNGDCEAYDKIFLRLYPILCAYASKFVGRDDAEEIVQDIMLWLWESRNTLVVETSLPQYLFRAVRNKCLSLLKHKLVKESALSQIHDDILDIESPNFYVVEELMENIEKAIEALPPTYREAFKLNRFENQTYDKIALMMGVSSKTIDYRIQQALKLLRVELKEYLTVGSVTYFVINTLLF